MAVSQELRIETEQAQAALDHLVSQRLVEQHDERFRLRPKRRRDTKLIAELADLYPTYRVAVISIIFSKPSGPIRDFCDAFRLRDED